jgi:HAD superfamily hydrolase (TIGR01509 family)
VSLTEFILEHVFMKLLYSECALFGATDLRPVPLFLLESKVRVGKVKLPLPRVELRSLGRKPRRKPRPLRSDGSNTQTSLGYLSATLARMADQTKLRAVLFDWDGTLIDSFHADSQSYLAMFAAMGVDWGLKELEQHYSPDWYAVYRAAEIPNERWDEADTLWRVHYAKHQSKLMPGARRVLAQIARRWKLGLVTSGDRDRVTRQLRAFRLTRTFGICVCGGDTKEKKPHPAPLLKALECMKVRAEEAVYVGDTPQDVEMARAAGVRAIAVLGPFPTEAGLRAARPEFLLEKLGELPGLLRELYGAERAVRGKARR